MRRRQLAVIQGNRMTLPVFIIRDTQAAGEVTCFGRDHHPETDPTVSAVAAAQRLVENTLNGDRLQRSLTAIN